MTLCHYYTYLEVRITPCTRVRRVRAVSLNLLICLTLPCPVTAIDLGQQII